MAATGKANARLGKELKTLQASPLDWAEVNIVDDNIMKWRAIIKGPEDSPYEGGKFTLELEMPPEYPFKHPSVKFATKTYHPNIQQKTGEICEEILKGVWSPQLKISEVLAIVRQMLSEPNISSPLDETIAQQYATDRSAYNKTAKEWTSKYAN